MYVQISGSGGKGERMFLMWHFAQESIVKIIQVQFW